jgi:hypothetical protein
LTEQVTPTFQAALIVGEMLGDRVLAERDTPE